MNLFNRKPKIVHEWQYQPYGFEPGQKYVIEIDQRQMSMQTMKELKQYFDEEGIVCKLVMTYAGTAINPVRVATHREIGK